MSAREFGLEIIKALSRVGADFTVELAQVLSRHRERTNVNARATDMVERVLEKLAQREPASLAVAPLVDAVERCADALELVAERSRATFAIKTEGVSTYAHMNTVDVPADGMADINVVSRVPGKILAIEVTPTFRVNVLGIVNGLTPVLGKSYGSPGVEARHLCDALAGAKLDGARAGMPVTVQVANRGRARAITVSVLVEHQTSSAVRPS